MQDSAVLINVRLELAQEDAVKTAMGVILPHKSTSTSFLIKGLELEEQQYVFFPMITVYGLLIMC